MERKGATYSSGLFASHASWVSRARRRRTTARDSPRNFENELGGPAVGGVAYAAADAEIENPRLKIEIERGVERVVLIRKGARLEEWPKTRVIFRSEGDTLHDFPCSLELQIEVGPGTSIGP